MSYPNTHTHAHTSQIHKTEKDSLTSAGNPSGLRERPRPPPSACPHPGKTQRSSLNLAGQQGRDGKITDSVYSCIGLHCQPPKTNQALVCSTEQTIAKWFAIVL